MISAVLICLLCSVTLQAQQRFEVKDRRGLAVLVLEDVRLSRYSDYFKARIPEFTALMTNLAEEDILAAKLVGLIHVHDGSTIKFPVYPTQDIPKDLAKGKVGYSFLKPWRFSGDGDIAGIEFRLEEAQHRALADGFHVSGFIAKDDGCLKDYLGARSLDGIALRKKIAELLQYGCGVFADPPLATGRDIQKKMLSVAGKRIAVAAGLFQDEARFLRGADHRDPQLGLVLVDEMRPGRVLTLEDIGVGEAK